eukprot:COSAG04_NODE_26562_length_293_cov_0.922680_1_plen_40_part_10
MAELAELSSGPAPLNEIDLIFPKFARRLLGGLGAGYRYGA